MNRVSNVLRLSIALSLLWLGCAPGYASANSGVRICSQNLHRFGASGKRSNPKKRDKQKRFLITRMHQARCDVVALQELAGKSTHASKRILDELASALSKRTGKTFVGYTGESHDDYIRNAFLIAKEAGVVQQVKSYWREPVPKLQIFGPARHYSRGPLGVLLRLRSSSPLSASRVFLLTMHLKSKSDAWKDPTQTSFESMRMEMAEGIRLLVAEEVARFGDGVVPILLGDRNSGIGSASASVLSGERVLEDFRSEQKCTIDKKLEPKCAQKSRRDIELIGLFEHRAEKFPRTKTPGSYRYKKKLSLIDEILVRPSDLTHFTRRNGSIAIGFEGQFYKGSDHKLLWVELLLGPS